MIDNILKPITVDIPIKPVFPRLLADIGGTNARFALEVAPRRFVALSVYANRDYSNLAAVLQDYLRMAGEKYPDVLKVRHAALAIATLVEGDLVKMTNSPWCFSITAVQKQFGFETMLVVNDFSALAMAVPQLDSTRKMQVGRGTAMSGSPIGVLGPGTGLGVSGLIPSGDKWIVLTSEGGHVSFSPADEIEAELLHQAWKHYPHVSAERLLSGMGLELIYGMLASRSGKPKDGLSPADIFHRSLEGKCIICDETISLFCSMLGTVAGNLALTLGACGGIYIGGGIVPRLGDRFINSSFRQRFEQKGRFSSWMEKIPTFVITEPNPAFFGVSAMLDEHLRSSI